MVSSLQRGRSPGSLAVMTVIFVAVFGAGCRHPTSPARSPLKLTTERSVYFPGDLVHFSIQNTSDESVITTDCNGALERRAGLVWVLAPTERACLGNKIRLAPGESAAMTEPLLTSLSPGRYRLVSGDILDDQGITVPDLKPSASEFDVKEKDIAIVLSPSGASRRIRCFASF